MKDSIQVALQLPTDVEDLHTMKSELAYVKTVLIHTTFHPYILAVKFSIKYWAICAGLRGISKGLIYAQQLPHFQQIYSAICPYPKPSSTVDSHTK